MDTTQPDLERLTATWSVRLPGCLPIGHELPAYASDRSVRFHSLPEAKRYPESAAEMSMILHRHNVVLTELFALTSQPIASHPSLFTMTYSWSEGPEPVPRQNDLSDLVPDAQFWQSLPPYDYSEAWTHIWVSGVPWKPGCVDPVLELVAEDKTGAVILAEPDLNWLYHPYDGGADIVAPTILERDALARNHDDWLPAIE